VDIIKNKLNKAMIICNL